MHTYALSIYITDLYKTYKDTCLHIIIHAKYKYKYT